MESNKRSLQMIQLVEFNPIINDKSRKDFKNTDETEGVERAISDVVIPIINVVMHTAIAVNMSSSMTAIYNQTTQKRIN